MPYTYPPAAPSISGDNVTISRFLNNPTLVARRLRTLLEQRYIADTLLSGRFNVEGGAVTYETGESIFSGENPRAVGPGSEYPLVSPATGSASIAKTVKWGQDALITDESIKRRAMDPVNRALIKLANQNVKYVDSVAIAAIASAVTATANAAADWSTATAEQILTDVALAKANIINLNEGYDPDVVVIDDVNHAYAMARFAAAGLMPREGANNPVVTGSFPVINGMTWLATSSGAATNKALVADSKQLGGMADEDLGGPGYAKVNGVGVEVKTIRDDENDQYRVRARRVTVPVVVEPAAARWIAAI
jgi:hypothetical protein